MAISDDKKDEVLRVMSVYTFTIKIGSDPSLAEYSLKEQPMLYDLLDSFKY